MTETTSRWAIGSSIAVISLSTVSSLLGLFRSGHYAATGGLLLRTRAEDLVVLVVAVPVLAFGLWSARRGSPGGQITWLGALAFMTYLWASRAVSVTVVDFFLGYVALFALSLFTLVGGVLGLAIGEISRRLQGALARRWYAGLLGIVAVGLAALWLVELVPAMLAGTEPAMVEAFGPAAAVTYVLDLGIVVPALAIVAGWLWQGRPVGFALAGVLLVFGALLAPALAAITLADLWRGVSMSPGLVVGTVVPPLVAGILAIRYLVALRSGAPSSVM